MQKKVNSWTGRSLRQARKTVLVLPSNQELRRQIVREESK